MFIEALHVAALNGHKTVVRRLVEVGFDVATPEGGKALRGAAERGQVAVVVLLLEKGADVNSKDKSVGTALVLGALERPRGNGAVAA